MPEGRFHHSLQRSLVPALPSVPAAPPGASNTMGQALPPLPALAILPPPPGAYDPGAPMLMHSGGTPAGGAVALALTDTTGKAPGAAAGRGQLVRQTAVSTAPKKDVSEKVFMIPGLQDRAYSEDEITLAFEMMDLDRHKELDATDLRRILDLCGLHKATDAEVAEMIRLFDPDGSGTVDYPEFRKNYVNPPALFRNFDLHRREVMDNLGEETPTPTPQNATQQSQMAALEAPPQVPALGYTPVPSGIDHRPKAIELIVGAKRKLRPEFIKQVYSRFVELDTDEMGTVAYLPFCMAFKRPPSEDMRAAFDIFDYSRTGELDLRELVVSLSMFTKSAVEDKLKFAFMMFDENQWNTLNRTDVTELLKAMAPHLPMHAFEDHVSRLYSTYSLHPRDRVNTRQFTEYVQEYADELVPGVPKKPQEDEEGTEDGTTDDGNANAEELALATHSPVSD